MASPQTNRLGIYVARIWVPTDLQTTLGKKEIVRSLRTRDPVEAKRLYKQVTAEFETEFEHHRTAREFVAPADEHRPEPRSISEREAHAMAGAFYRSLIEQHQDNPGSPDQWERRLLAIQRCIPEAERIPGCIVPFASDNQWAFHHSKNAFHALNREVRAFLDERSDNLDGPSFMKLCAKVALAKRDAFEQLVRNAKGDFDDDPKAKRFPDIAIADRPNPRAFGIACEDLIELWRTVPGYSAKTFKSWSGKLRMLMAFANRTDVAELTKLDVERWRDHRIMNERIAPNTVSSGDLAGVRGVLGWAATSTLVPAISTNVAEGVRQKRAKRVRTGPKGFTLEEANLILRNTLEPVTAQLPPTSKALRRWVPWLCAYSGARVGEIGQLHSSRVFQDITPDGEAIWCMRLTPEDGTIKTGESRIVPIHPHVLEQGFLEYVEERKGLPLFYNPKRARGSEKGNRQADKVGERIAKWVRDLGIVRDVQPNHGWRHRFETFYRRPEVRQDIVDSITGHAPATTSGDYGDYLTKVKFDLICEIPHYLAPHREPTES